MSSTVGSMVGSPTFVGSSVSALMVGSEVGTSSIAGVGALVGASSADVGAVVGVTPAGVTAGAVVGETFAGAGALVG